MMLAIALWAAQPALPPPDERLVWMTALYDEICLRTFPDDAAVDAAMRRRGATPLTPEQVRVTLVDDPGRGWRLAGPDGYALVFVEMPPYHACSVRWPMPSMPNLDGYRRIADAYEQAHPSFTSMPPLDFDAPQDGLHVHIASEQSLLAGGRHDTLMVVDQHVIDPARRAAGETGIELRFVHQIAEADAH